MPADAPQRRHPTEYARFFETSAKMRGLGGMVGQVATTNATVLILGESGVGKELVARAIHAASERIDRPWIKVNCAALPGELLESELFGHERGAFTGAHRQKLGKFELANTGTIFLDEIGELAPPLQAKLLHVLQDLSFSRVGGHSLLPVDVRIIAATNRNLLEAIRQNHFREDLYYRLSVVELHIPPLRERREEIEELARHFVGLFNAQYNRTVELPADLLDAFLQYSWPGNVRELENLVRRFVVLGDATHIRTELESRLRTMPACSDTTAIRTVPQSASSDIGLKEITRRAAIEAECQALREVLERVRWNRTEAARILKVSYKTLLNKMAACGLGSPRARQKAPVSDEHPGR
jgi:two-component system response regulator AtoC